jgi:hypothetical protein
METVPDILTTTAQSYAHDLVCNAKVTSVKRLKFTLGNEKEAEKFSFIDAYDMAEIKAALASIEVIYY